MKLTDFHYELPENLIAQHPLPERRASRLLCLARDGGAVEDRRFAELPALLNPGDLLVFNDTRVIPARLFAHKETGGRVEILVERVTGDRTLLAQLRANKSPKVGGLLVLEDGSGLRLTGRSEGFFQLQAVDRKTRVLDVLERLGHMPLPPYIRRPDEAEDRDRYQTVYAQRPGAVAAPTAGLHFDEAMLEELERCGIEVAHVTLHVGAGTFQPVRVTDVEQHRMHAEYLEVSSAACGAVDAARERGGRVVAVGTTTVRCLETASASGRLEPFRGESRLFIYPGYEFRAVDGLITNFHLPGSTLLMLVCALAGRQAVLAAYRHAVERRYRFFSYGDAMLIL